LILKIIAEKTKKQIWQAKQVKLATIPVDYLTRSFYGSA